MPNDAHKRPSFSSCPGLITPLRYPVYRLMLSVVSISAMRVVSNFYHDLIDRFSMSGALFFTFLFDNRGGIVDQKKTASKGRVLSPSFPSIGIYTCMLICS